MTPAAAGAFSARGGSTKREAILFVKMCLDFSEAVVAKLSIGLSFSRQPSECEIARFRAGRSRFREGESAIAREAGRLLPAFAAEFARAGGDADREAVGEPTWGFGDSRERSRNPAKSCEWPFRDPGASACSGESRGIARPRVRAGGPRRARGSQVARSGGADFAPCLAEGLSGRIIEIIEEGAVRFRVCNRLEVEMIAQTKVQSGKNE
jgi:hypothetical protein